MFLVKIRRQQRSTRTETLVPDTTLFRTPILTPAARPCAASSMRNQRRRNRRPGHARDERAVRSDCRGIRHLDRRRVGRHTMDSSRPWLSRDRKSVVWGKSVSVRVDLGGGRIIKKKQKMLQIE